MRKILSDLIYFHKQAKGTQCLMIMMTGKISTQLQLFGPDAGASGLNFVDSFLQCKISLFSFWFLFSQRMILKRSFEYLSFLLFIIFSSNALQTEKNEFLEILITQESKMTRDREKSTLIPQFRMRPAESNRRSIVANVCDGCKRQFESRYAFEQHRRSS
jgi:hypothetical protein